MGAIQGALDVAGMIPVIGEVADGANALLYVAQGDYAMAALSAASMIPLVGNVTGAAKLGAKYADDVIAVAARWGDEAAAAGKQGDEALGAAGRACKNSFSPDTPVTLADGSQVPIASVEEGDRVLAWHEASGTTGSYPVTHVWLHEDPVTGWVEIDGGPINTTPNHPFFTVERGWVEAAELRLGDHVPSASGGSGLVTSITWDHAPAQMYDLTVDVAHTFFVGDAGWLVHNCGPSSRALAANMESAGSPRSAGSAAHHIVAGASPRAAEARSVLGRHGIDINDAANGVWLPATKQSPNGAGAAVHSTTHTVRYYTEVNRILGGATSRGEVLDALGSLRGRLLGGGL
jgi:hypothetical protein